MIWLIHADLSPSHSWKASAEALIEAIGEGATVVAPTFTYSFCQGRPFDRLKSRGESGLFGNYLLSRPEAIRSDHPIFSFAAVGPQAEELLTGLSPSAFGPGSLFERLDQRGGTLLFAGAPFQSCTYVHYVEQKVGVSYRSSLWFSGFEYFARPLDGSVVTDLSRLEERLKAKGVLHPHPTGGFSISIQTLVEETEKALLEEPYFLLKNC